MGLRDVIDAQVPPHGAWQGARVGTVVSLWRCHILAERAPRLVTVRDGGADRPQPFHPLLALPLRDTECTADRLAHIRRRLGTPTTPAALEAALLRQWVRVYRWPTETRRLDTTSVSGQHDPTTDDSLLQQGHSTDQRPDWRQWKALLAPLAPLGLPLVCQPVAGHRADDGLQVPAQEAATAALGPSQVWGVGDSKMGALATRGHIAAGQRGQLCADRPPSATEALAVWREQAVTRAATWQRLETGDPQTGEIRKEVVIDAGAREQRWPPPEPQGGHRWTERVRVARSSAYPAGWRRRHERARARLTAALVPLWQPPGRGRKRDRSREALACTGAERVAQVGLPGVGQTALAADPRPDGTPRWMVAAVWGHLAAGQALVERLGWQVDVTNPTAVQYPAPALVASQHQHALEERGLSRVKTRHLHMRPGSLRDAQRRAGLRWLLCLALRVLPLTEQRWRPALVERGEQLAGRTPASRAHTTVPPTTARVLATFATSTVPPIQATGACDHHGTPLNSMQRHVLDVLQLPAALYEPLAQPSANLGLHLRE